MDYINELIEKGYKYLIMPTRNKKTFFATKAVQKKDGTFKDSANFDEYQLTKDEMWPFDKNVYINLLG